MISSAACPQASQIKNTGDEVGRVGQHIIQNFVEMICWRRQICATNIQKIWTFAEKNCFLAPRTFPKNSSTSCWVWLSNATVFFWRTVGYQHQNIYSRRLVFPFGLEAIKPLQLVGQVAEFKFESKFEPLLPCLSSGNISGSACAGLSSPALLARIGWASTNTGRSQVGCSRCWPRLACLRKTCYYSCNSYSVQE